VVVIFSSSTLIVKQRCSPSF